MIRTYQDALNAVAERTYDNTKDIRQMNRQRRHQVVDIYGAEFTRQGDGGTPATFYISISPDLVYLERFSFKLIVQPFVSTVSTGGLQSATVTVNNRSLSVSNDTISPNPHNHTTQPHTHNVVSGVALVHTTASDFGVSIEGVDVTPYLAAQYGEWIDGEGVYPTLEIEHNYDILEVISDLRADGRDSEAALLEAPGYKPVAVTSGAPFQVTMSLYLKYSHLNR